MLIRCLPVVVVVALSLFAFEDDSASSGRLASQKDTIGTPGALVRLQEIQYGIEKGALSE